MTITLGATGLACMLAAWLGVGMALASEAEMLHYTARLHGVALIEANFCLSLTKISYEAALAARTMGLVDVLVHGRSESHVDGAIGSGKAVEPHAYADHGRLNGEDYATAIDYPAGDPVLRRQLPPQEKYRLTIPAETLPGTVDGLSSVVMQSVAAGRGTCAGQVRVFDGHEIRRMTMHDGVSDTLVPDPRSVFAGQALRCETEFSVLAGFLKSESAARQSRSRHGQLWLAPALPGGPAVPVRMVFDADIFGEIIVSLDGVLRTQSGCGAVHDAGRASG